MLSAKTLFISVYRGFDFHLIPRFSAHTLNALISSGVRIFVVFIPLTLKPTDQEPRFENGWKISTPRQMIQRRGESNLRNKMHSLRLSGRFLAGRCWYAVAVEFLTVPSIKFGSGLVFHFVRNSGSV